MITSAKLQQDRIFDVIIIGGGITGAGVARDAALRGLSCLLLEKGDFASGVTSKSTRLIHGGLRYLANFDMGLVAESLRERAILRKQAPYLIHPMPILIPIYKGDPHGRALISLGIHLYDLLSHERDIPHYFTSNREKTLGFEPRLNQEGLKGSALFYDHQILMPERLVIENVISAREAGAQLMNYTQAERIEESSIGVVVTAKDMLTNTTERFRSRVLINAAGPWIDRVRQAGDINQAKIIFPSKGIHLILPRFSEQALFVTSRDGRMFFIIPLGGHSLIGTTDNRYEGDLDEVYADRADVDYLLSESSRILPRMNLSREGIFHTYAGIRPLAFTGTDETRISRKHRVIVEGDYNRIITIAGGKLTTYRKMAKDALDAACAELGVRSHCVTDKKPLAGGLPTGYEEYLQEAVPDLSDRHRVSPGLVRHLISLYGVRAEKVLELIEMEPSLGEGISPESGDVYAQVLYGVVEEGVRTVSDIVLRRLPLGITASRGREQAEKIAALMGKELLWNNDERQHHIAEFKKTVDKDTACLKT